MNLLQEVIKQFAIIKEEKMMKAVIKTANLPIGYRGTLHLLSGVTSKVKQSHLKKLHRAANIYLNSEYRKLKKSYN